jgi:N-acetylglucosamine kinase-like BadF-type ATPase
LKRFFLGADVGGTKTHVIIADEEGQIVGEGKGGPGNHEVVGYPGLQNVLIDCMNDALLQAGLKKNMIAGSGFGIAGYDWESEKESTQSVIKTLGLKTPVNLVNDAIIGLLAGAPQGWGVALVSGTGCNCRGWDQTHQHEGRVVGRSSLVGEGAGCTELMSEVIKALAYEWTLRGPHTELTPAIIQFAGAKSLEDFLEGYCEGRYDLQSFSASLVFQIASMGDEVALTLINWAGNELGELANAVIRQLNFEQLKVDIVLIGSMFEGGELLFRPMREKILSLAPSARFCRLSAPPTIGAVLLGMDAAGYKYPAAIREKLIFNQQQISKEK